MHRGSRTPTAPGNLPVQDPTSARLVKQPASDATFEFDVAGPSKGVRSGGLVAKATFTNVQGIGAGALLGVAVERFSAEQAEPGGTQWTTVNQDYNQSLIYLQSGMQVEADDLVFGRYRLRVFNRSGAAAAVVDATLRFTKGRAWPDPGQRPYDVSNLDLFEELKPFVGKDQLTAVPAADVVAGRASLSAYDTVIAADRTTRDARTATALGAFAEAGGNIVLTDDALTALGAMGVVDPGDVVAEAVYAGSVAFTAPDGASTYDDPLAANVNLPGSPRARTGGGRSPSRSRPATRSRTPTVRTSGRCRNTVSARLPGSRPADASSASRATPTAAR